MNELAKRFRKRLKWFSDNAISGEIIVKLSHRSIVFLKNTENATLSGPVEERPNIPAAKCEYIVDTLVEENFFGDLILNYYAGRIVSIGLLELYKPDEVENRFPARRNKQCLSGC
jgi:hypothetical protein